MMVHKRSIKHSLSGKQEAISNFSHEMDPCCTKTLLHKLKAFLYFTQNVKWFPFLSCPTLSTPQLAVPDAGPCIKPKRLKNDFTFNIFKKHNSYSHGEKGTDASISYLCRRS